MQKTNIQKNKLFYYRFGDEVSNPPFTVGELNLFEVIK